MPTKLHTRGACAAQVRALTGAEQEAMGRDAPPRSQAIFGLDMAAWTEWKRRVRPADPLMPHRPPFEFPGRAAAAGLHAVLGQPLWDLKRHALHRCRPCRSCHPQCQSHESAGCWSMRYFAGDRSLILGGLPPAGTPPVQLPTVNALAEGLGTGCSAGRASFAICHRMQHALQLGI